jgi:hypothetical protein
VRTQPGAEGSGWCSGAVSPPLPSPSSSPAGTAQYLSPWWCWSLQAATDRGNASELCPDEWWGDRDGAPDDDDVASGDADVDGELPTAMARVMRSTPRAPPPPLPPGGGGGCLARRLARR